MWGEYLLNVLCHRQECLFRTTEWNIYSLILWVKTKFKETRSLAQRSQSHEALGSNLNC